MSLTIGNVFVNGKCFCQWKMSPTMESVANCENLAVNGKLLTLKVSLVMENVADNGNVLDNGKCLG